MLRVPLLACVTSLAVIAAASAGDVEPGFTPIFDGETLDGWTQKGGEAEYTVEDGMIVGKAVPNTPNSFLCTEKTYGDFELRLEFQCDDRLNSGIMFRAQSSPDYKDGRVHGYQCEIDPSDRAASAGIYDEARRGWLTPTKEEEGAFAKYKTRAGGYFKNGGWNEYIIRCEGDHITTTINGLEGSDLIDATDAEGFIGLQVHNIRGDEYPDPPMLVKWRNIRIKELK